MVCTSYKLYQFHFTRTVCQTNLVVDSLLMVRRPMQTDVPFSMFHDKRILLEGVDKDFWWLNPNGQIEVKVIETNNTFSIAEYIYVFTYKYLLCIRMVT